MAFMNKERKAELAPAIKRVLKKYGMKGSLRVENYSKLVLTMPSGKLDIVEAAKRKSVEVYGREEPYEIDYYRVNEFHDAEGFRKIGENEIADFVEEMVEAMRGKDFFDESDAMTDYFHCSHYIDINVGKWDKPYTCVA